MNKVLSNRGDFPTLDVEITSHLGDNQSYEEGDSLSFLINLSKTAWVTILYENSEGVVYQLSPSNLHPKPKMPQGDFIEFPSDRSPLNLEVAPPFGTEKVWILATSGPLKSLATETHTKTLKQISGSLEKAKQTLLNQVRHRKLVFAEDELIFHTKQ